MKTLFLLLALCPGLYTAQTNLAMNGSFEDLKCKPHATGGIHYANNMSSSNNTSVDIFSTRNCYRPVRAPKNYMGVQDPYQGEHYAGIIAYYGDEWGIGSWTMPGYQNYTEYIQVELAQPLEAGKAYNVSFRTSLAEGSAYAVSGLGMYFSKDKLNEKSNSYLDTVIEPNLVVPEVVKNTDWALVEGYYKASGGEKFLTIGVFEDYMDIEKVIPENTNNSRKAYYYIDAITLGPVTEPANNGGFDVVLLGGCFEFQKLHFETDKAVILPESFDELNNLAAFLRKYPSLAIYVDGHTDKTGTDTHNQKLSEERASAVKQYLVNKGVKASHLRTRGYGSNNPIDTQNIESQTNRRVEITVCYAGPTM